MSATHSRLETQLKLGVSHQRPKDLNDERFRFLKRLGVEAIEVRLPSEQADRQTLKEITDRVGAAGIELHEIMLEDLYNSTAIALDLPKRQSDLEFFQGFIRNLGELGVPHTTYAWFTGGMYETHREETRGTPTRGFSTAKAESAPLVADREYSEAELWERYQWFADQILPVAESSGVKLQLHPNDPPLDHQGVPRIFKSTKAFRKGLDMGRHSPSWNILFCVGTWAEMSGPDGRGEDVAAALREFGRAGYIAQVHMRNITRSLPDFAETFPDDGYLDLHQIMDVLVDIEFNGMIVPDHVPGGTEDLIQNEAYTLGYLRALIQYGKRELSRRQSASVN